MNSYLGFIAFAASGLLGQLAIAQSAPAPLTNQDDKVSYSIGVNIGTGLKQQTEQQGLHLKPDLVAAGLRDALSGSKTLLTEQDVRDTLTALDRTLHDKMASLAEKNKREGDAFLAQNKTKPGIMVLPDGLQYQVLTQGTGPKPKATDTVKVKYKGTLIDGTEFDSSDKHGGFINIQLNRVIRGWTEALQMMPVGSKWRLFIPSELAYGASGLPTGTVGPNATLIFDVELLGIEPAAK